MSGLILPIIDFSEPSKSNNTSKTKSNNAAKIKSNNAAKIKSNNAAKIKSIKNSKSTQSKTSIKTKYVKQTNKINTKSESDTESEIDIDDIDCIIYKNGFPSDESESDEEIKAVQIVEEVFDGSPVYDGVEPYYIYKRRLDLYLNNKMNRPLHTQILNFINILFDSEYTSLISIKKIEATKIPISKYIVDLIKEDENFKKLFKIRCSENIPSDKMIDSLLNKVNFSFVKIESKKGDYYCVKTGINRFNC